MALNMTSDWTVEIVGASISSSSRSFARVAKKSGRLSGKSGQCLVVSVAPIEHLMKMQRVSDVPVYFDDLVLSPTLHSSRPPSRRNLTHWSSCICDVRARRRFRSLHEYLGPPSTDKASVNDLQAPC